MRGASGAGQAHTQAVVRGGSAWCPTALSSGQRPTDLGPALLGKEMCAKVSGFMCAMTCAVLLSWLFFSSLPVLFADLINPFD